MPTEDDNATLIRLTVSLSAVVRDGFTQVDLGQGISVTAGQTLAFVLPVAASGRNFQLSGS